MRSMFPILMESRLPTPVISGYDERDTEILHLRNQIAEKVWERWFTQSHRGRLGELEVVLTSWMETADSAMQRAVSAERDLLTERINVQTAMNAMEAYKRDLAAARGENSRIMDAERREQARLIDERDTALARIGVLKNAIEDSILWFHEMANCDTLSATETLREELKAALTAPDLALTEREKAREL